MTVSPTVQKNKAVSAIWILPIIALCICGWLLYTSHENAGVDIVIYFEDATGITPGKTQVIARGIPVGLVKIIHPDLSSERIKAVVSMEKEVVKHLVEDTLFWIVKPELSASSVQGLDTILSGSYIGIQVGSSKVPRLEFTGLSTTPPVAPDNPGLHIHLRAETLGSIQVGTGIYYKNIEIGSVQKHQLEGDKNILIDIFIKEQYAHLVREGSRFCNASGVHISGKLPNIKIQIESLASLLKGGILLHTPEQLLETPQVINGNTFRLYPDYEAANYGVKMSLLLASGQDIVEGSTKVMYRGLEAGFVEEISFEEETRTVTAHILLDPRAEPILRKNTKFWLVKPTLSAGGVKNLRLLLTGAHITFEPGGGEFKDHFDILPEPPPQKPLRPGKSFTLISKKPVDLSLTSPVYYKNIQVGEVTDITIREKDSSIQTTIFIYEKFLNHLTQKTIFWIHSGVEFKASISSGLELSSSPLASLLYGGISFTSPPKSKKIDLEKESSFILHNSFEDAIDAEPALQPVGKHILLIAKHAKSLSIGSPILYKHIKIGEIKGFRLTRDKNNVLIECQIFKKYQDIIRERTRFYSVSGIEVSASLKGLELQTGSLESILSGGIGCTNIGSTGSTKTPKKPYPLYKNLQAASQQEKIEITLHFDDSQGIKEGAQIHYKGIDIGQIETLTLTDDLNSIVGKATIDNNHSRLFRKDSLIWLEDTEISLNGIKNLSSVLTGPTLHILPGSGPLHRDFIVYTNPPHKDIANSAGLGIVLEAKRLGSISVGSPVYYREVQVGQITGVELSESFQTVLIHANISKPYQNIVRENSKFWNVSGTKIEGGIFSGITFAAASLETIMRGGVAFATPEEILPVAKAGVIFPLYTKPDPQWLDWNPNGVLLEKQKENIQQGMFHEE